MDKMGFWNTRGLNRPDKQRKVMLFLHNSKVSLFVLLETKIKRDKAPKATLNLYEGWSFTTNLSMHLGGRIWVVWKPVVFDVNINMITKQLIHCKVHHKRDSQKISIIFVYGFNDQGLRRSLWESIGRIHSFVQEPWAIMGD
ncbi:hypothetical protein FXO38_02129 [Capsicum annuum]|uniref:Uncharacterized protein n=1 Tax=Capsicum annuum TaxID=4072 RepID=A0A2G2YTV0_CAPAN|nr:hypothetical protein FXO37_04018 [Capsicum annuum]KAF3680744.1 hypothetical protein FXO38_02129 [Capsicum annuum]PHT73051.1 hypothetical protein T459_23836 [Capsicum annuum]